MKIFQNLNFVLVETSHPGNIGACARAMNSMGICNLSLVNPREFPSKESEARAKSGKKVLDQANIHDNLNEAINTSNLVIGTSARSRSMPWPMMEINNLGKVINESLVRKEKVSIVFGNEAVGLDNEDLGKCDFHLQIPTSEDSSLNLSHAVQIISYVLKMEIDNIDLLPKIANESPTFQENEHLIDHFDEVMKKMDFYDQENPKQVRTRMRRLIKRLQPDKLETGILRGFLAKIEQILNKKN